MALYRKYRPATFADVIGQDHVTKPLSTALDSGHINHAYLFSGPRGCGKTSSARIMARSLNCAQGPTSTPCGQCPSCISLAPGGPGNLDVTELDAASHNGVEDMRELRDRAFYAPAESRYRVFIIDEAHMITNAGSNALLKIVEEPPEHLIFIFATTEPEKVIGTIRSRTHHYPFRLLTPTDMRGLLERTTQAEGVHVDDAVYPLVIRAGGGSPRDSLSILDQLLAGAGPEGLTYDMAVPLLGVTDATLIDGAINALAAQDAAGLYTTINGVIEAGHDPRRFTSDLLDRLRDLMILQTVPTAFTEGLIDVPVDYQATLHSQATTFAPGQLARLASLVNDGLADMRGATSPRLLLEILAAKMLLPQAATHATLPAGAPASTAAGASLPAAPKPGAYERPSQRAAREAAEKAAREAAAQQTQQSAQTQAQQQQAPAQQAPAQQAQAQQATVQQAQAQPATAQQAQPAQAQPAQAQQVSPQPAASETSQVPQVAAPASPVSADAPSPQQHPQAPADLVMQPAVQPEVDVHPERPAQPEQAQHPQAPANTVQQAAPAMSHPNAAPVTNVSSGKEQSASQTMSQPPSAQPTESAAPAQPVAPAEPAAPVQPVAPAPTVDAAQASMTHAAPAQPQGMQPQGVQPQGMQPQGVQPQAEAALEAEAATLSAAAFAEQVRSRWAEIRRMVSKKSQVTGVMLTEARVLGVRDNTVVLGHNTGALAARLNADNNNKVLVEVITQVFGEPFGAPLQVHCEVGLNPKKAGFAPAADPATTTAPDMSTTQLSQPVQVSQPAREETDEAQAVPGFLHARAAVVTQTTQSGRDVQHDEVQAGEVQHERDTQSGADAPRGGDVAIPPAADMPTADMSVADVPVEANQVTADGDDDAAAVPSDHLAGTPADEQPANDDVHPDNAPLGHEGPETSGQQAAQPEVQPDHQLADVATATSEHREHAEGEPPQGEPTYVEQSSGHTAAAGNAGADATVAQWDVPATVAADDAEPPVEASTVDGPVPAAPASAGHASAEPEPEPAAPVSPEPAVPQPVVPQPAVTQTAAASATGWADPKPLGGANPAPEAPTSVDVPPQSSANAMPANAAPVGEERPKARWELAAERGRKALSEQPAFSDGVPLPPEPDFEAPPPPPPAEPPAEPHRPDGMGRAMAAAAKVGPTTRAFAAEPRSQEEEEAEMIAAARAEPGSADHRDAKTVAMDLLAEHLGARPI